MSEDIKEILENQKVIKAEDNYEKIIFEYLANNCSEFSDEHIKQLVNLKVKQYKQLLDCITNLQDEYEKEHYLVDKLTRQLNDEYKNTEYQCKQKERLNNIINELEKYLIKMSDRSWDDNGAYDDVLDKIKELKGSDKSEK